MEEIKEEQVIQIQIEKKILEIEEIIYQMTKAEKIITKREKKMKYCQRYYLKQVKKK